jgi:RimJ/RimL family protein N-acetyltransferase
MAEAPVLTTERLVLRGHRLSDFDALHAMRLDPEVYRFISGKPATPDESWFRLLRSRGHWELLGFGYWVVEDRFTGEVLGEMGLGEFRRAMDRLPQGAENGWSLKSSVHGKGLATEGLTAILAWGDRHLAVPNTWCMILPEHAISLRLAAKLGYRESFRAPYLGEEVIILERQRPS